MTMTEIKYIGLQILLMVSIYFVGVFLSWEVNPNDWGTLGRITYIIFWVASAVISTSVYISFVEEDS